MRVSGNIAEPDTERRLRYHHHPVAESRRPRPAKRDLTLLHIDLCVANPIELICLGEHLLEWQEGIPHTPFIAQKSLHLLRRRRIARHAGRQQMEQDPQICALPVGNRREAGSWDLVLHLRLHGSIDNDD